MTSPAVGRDRSRWEVRKLGAARVVSSSGSQAAELALVYQIYVLTKSGFWVALVLFSSISVGGLLAPLAGWSADHFDRRRLMVVSELTAGATYLAMVFAHRPGILLAGALVAAALGSPFRAASAAAIPNLVVTDDLAWANALLGTAFNVALVGGPLLGGALVAASGAGLVFAVNAASFAASGVMIAFTAGSFGGRRGSGDATLDNATLDNANLDNATLDNKARDFFAGFRVIVSNRSLAPLYAASALAYASFGAALVIDPALSRFFHAGSVGYGLLTTVWGGGAVVGAILAGRVVTVSRAHAAVAWGMAAMAVSLGSVALLPTFALIVAAGAIGGTGSGFVFIPWLLLIQHHSSDAVRGRVVAAAEAFDQIAFLVGMGAAVPAISIAKPHHAYALAGIFLLFATAVVAATGRSRDVAVEPAA